MGRGIVAFWIFFAMFYVGFWNIKNLSWSKTKIAGVAAACGIAAAFVMGILILILHMIG